MRSSSAPQLKGMVLDADALSQANAAPQLPGMTLDPDDQGSFPANSPSSFLGNIGGELENFANDSSGVGGLFLPGLAQQMQNNASPIVQNQLQMSMAYPPALLQKMMMASGGIPDVATQTLAQGLGIKGNPSLKTIPAAIGQYIQGALRAGSSPESMIGRFDPQFANYLRSDEAPALNYNINKGLNVPNSSLNNTLESVIRQSIPIAGIAMGGELPGEGLNDESLVNFRSALERKIGKLGPEPLAPTVPGEPRSILASHDTLLAASKLNNARGTLEVAHGPNGIHGSLASDYLKTLNSARSNYRPALDIHGDKVPSFLSESKTAPIDITKPLSLKDGTKFSSSELKILQSKYPEDFNALQKQYNNENEAFKNPVKNWLGNDDYSTAQSYAKKQMNDVTSNPSIRNQYELKEALDKHAASTDNYGEKIKLKSISNKINQEGILTPLKQFDSQYGTNTAAPYAGADKFFKESVGPYRANKTIYNVATGADTKVPLNKLSDAIDVAQRTPSKYRFDSNTGLPLSQISPDHILSSVYKPSIDNLYKSVNDAQNNYNGAVKSQDMVKNNLETEHNLAMQKYKENTKAYQTALDQRQKQIENIKNAPTVLQKYGRKALYGAAGLSGLDYLRHLLL